MFEKLGKFEIKRLLGHGAMGEVYLGVDPTIGREVAIKTILATAAQGEDAKQRFEREAKAAGVLNHPNLVTIYEFGEDQGVLYIAMEYVKGQDLEEILREASLTRSEALEILAQVCDGLDYAHHAHIVHRDIKPSNVRVIREGKRLHAKVMDFGVARVANSDMTATGMVMGTVSYMAPEYIRTGKPDPRSDLFAVGVMLYECLSGRKPFAGDTTPTILYKIVNESPEPVDADQLRGISPSIRTVLDRGLDKDPDRRFQTAEDFAKALRAAKDPTWQGHLEQATHALQAASSPTGAAPTAMLPAVGADATVRMSGTIAQPVPEPRKKSRLPLLLASGLAGLVLLSAGAYAAWRFQAGAKPIPPESEAAGNAVNASGSPDPKAAYRPRESRSPASAPSLQVQPQPGGVPQIQAPSFRDLEQKAQPSEVSKPGKPETTGADAKFAPERLENMEVHERANLGNITLSEAIQSADSNPDKAVAGFRQAIAADPSNEKAYTWLVAVLYEQKKFGEIPTVLRQARSHGIRRGQMMSNIRFRGAVNKDRLNRRVPELGEE